MSKYSLRPVNLIDCTWLWELKTATMRVYVEQTWGLWDEAQQKKYFFDGFMSNSSRIIVVDSNRDAGFVQLERRGSEFFLNRIEIAPEFQRRGIGTAVMTDILAEARSVKKPVRLQVLRVNPARAFYLRFGFIEIGETSTHALMDWMP